MTTEEWARLLRGYVSPHRRLVSWLALVLFATIGLQLLTPQLLREFIDRAIEPGTDTLTAITLLYLAAAALQQLTTVAATWLGEIVGWKATNELRADVMDHCLTLDPKFFEDHPPGALIERVDGDVNGLSQFFAQFVLSIIGNVLLVVGILAVVVIRSPGAGLWLVALAVLSATALLSVRRVAATAWQQSREDSAELFGYIEERLSATEDIRASAAEAHTQRGFYARARELIWSVTRARVRDAIVWSTNTVLSAIGHLVALIVPVFQVRSGAMTVGEAFAFYFYATLLIQPMSNMSQQVEQVQQAIAGGRRVVALLDIEPTMVDGPDASLPAGPLDVELSSMTFGYDPALPVLRDIDLHLPAGRVLGVVGRTGAGKSSLARLLVRLHDPDAGTVLIGGVDIRTQQREHLRHRVALVTQDVHVLHATVRDNLTLFDDSVTDDVLLDAINRLGLESWFASLPDGLDTIIEQGGAGMSAGESQLLAFGRALLVDPSVVVLDEASSRLDPATEDALEHAVDGLLDGRTGIVIAHRLSTLDRCDLIAVFDRGELVEFGPRWELAAANGSRFAALLRATEEVLAP